MTETEPWDFRSRGPGQRDSECGRSVRRSIPTGGDANVSEKKPADGKQIRSGRDSKLVRDIHYCVSQDENIHSVDYKYAAIINDSA